MNDITWRDCPSSSDTGLTLPTDKKLLQYAIVNWTIPTPIKRGEPVGSDVVEIQYPDLQPLMAFPLGITEVVYTLNDKRNYTGLRTPPVCQFFVTVNDIEKPSFVGASNVEVCGEEDVGVALDEQCGGYSIQETKSVTNFRVNEAVEVTSVLQNCCNNRMCTPYKNSLISICQ